MIKVKDGYAKLFEQSIKGNEHRILVSNGDVVLKDTTSSANSLVQRNAQGLIVSTLASGKAPFVVSSTDLVANLNANYLDGTSKGGLFTELTTLKEAANNLSITIGGTTKKIGVNYLTYCENIAATTYSTVKGHKDRLLEIFNSYTHSFGNHVMISNSVVSLWDNDSAATYNSSTWNFVKIGPYSGADYGLWLLSSFGDCRIGYVGRDNKTWTKLRWLAHTDDLNNYLPLTGGIIKNGANRNPLTIDATSVGGYINFALNGTICAFVGYNNSLGAFLETDDGAKLHLKGSSITFNNNKVYHAGNFNPGNYVNLSSSQNITGDKKFNNKLTVYTTASNQTPKIVFDEYYNTTLGNWISEIISDYYGTNVCTTEGFTHGLYIVLGRGNPFDNLNILDSTKTPIARISKDRGHYFSGTMSVTGSVTLGSDVYVTGNLETDLRVRIKQGQALEWIDSAKTSCLLLPRSSNSYRLDYYNGTGWSWILDSSNYSSYALPLSGGTVSNNTTTPLIVNGTESVETNIRIQRNGGNTSVFGYKDGIGTRMRSSLAHKDLIITDDGVLKFGDESSYSTVYHSGNLSPITTSGGTINSNSLYIKKDLGGTLSEWVNKSLHNGPFEVGRKSNTMCVAIGVTDDDYGYIQSKGINITSSGKLVLQPAGGELLYSSSKYKIWHEGNDGNGSGLDADLLDGQEGSWYVRNVLTFQSNNGTSVNGGIDLNSLTYGLVSNYGSYAYWANAPTGMTYGMVLNLKSSLNNELMGQLAWDINHRGADSTRYLYWRANDDRNFATAKWHQIAFTDSNVASATKLQTARTIWGQSFDGSSDISGELSGVTSINSDGSIVLIGGATNNYSGAKLHTKGFIESTDGYKINSLDVLRRKTDELAVGQETAVYASLPTSVYGTEVKLRYSTDRVTGLILNSSGDVGIGTTSPKAKLNVVIPNTIETALRLFRENSSNNNYGCDMLLLAYENKGLTIGGGGFGGVFMYYNGSTNSEIMKLSASGNVGIGTTSPSSKLDVQGDIYTSSALKFQHGQLITNSYSGNGFILKSGSGTNIGELAYHQDHLYLCNYFGSKENSGIECFDNGDVSLFTKVGRVLYILNNGNAGIGTTSPSYKLDVNGSLNATTINQNGKSLNYLYYGNHNKFGGFSSHGKYDLWYCIAECTVDNVSNETSLTLLATKTYSILAKCKAIIHLEVRNDGTPIVNDWSAFVSSTFDLSTVKLTTKQSGNNIIIKVYCYNSGWASTEFNVLGTGAWGQYDYRWKFYQSLTSTLTSLPSDETDLGSPSRDTLIGKFKREDSSDSYILLGGGGHKALNTLFSDLSSSTTNAVSITIGGTTKNITASTLKTSLGLGSNAYTSTAYLPLTGGTINGTNTEPLTINTTSATSSIMFQRSSVNKAQVGWDNGLGAFLVNIASGYAIGVKDDGTPIFYNGSSKTLIHSGNIGSLSVNYASSAGNANTLDGIDSSRFLRDMHIGALTNKDLNYANNMYGTWNYGDDSTLKNTPTKLYGAYISFGDLASSDSSTSRNQTAQIGVNCWDDLGRMYVRARQAGQRNVTSISAWRTVAFTTDTVEGAKNWGGYSISVGAAGTNSSTIYFVT